MHEGFGRKVEVSPKSGRSAAELAGRRRGMESDKEETREETR